VKGDAGTAAMWLKLQMRRVGDPYIPEAGKTNPVSHGQCVSVQLLSSQQEANMPYDIMTALTVLVAAACVLRAVRA
jgi:hypothetical protein